MQGNGVFALLNRFFGKLGIFVFTVCSAGILLLCCWNTAPNPKQPANDIGPRKWKVAWIDQMSSDVEEIKQFFSAEAEEFCHVTRENLLAIRDLFSNPKSAASPNDVTQVQIDDFEVTSERLITRREIESKLAKVLSNDP